jgi:hypothetical protein
MRLTPPVFARELLAFRVLVRALRAPMRELVRLFAVRVLDRLVELPVRLVGMWFIPPYSGYMVGAPMSASLISFQNENESANAFLLTVLRRYLRFRLPMTRFVPTLGSEASRFQVLQGSRGLVRTDLFLRCI